MFKKFLKDENGQGMVEYALILALIAIVVIAAVTLLGEKVNTVFGDANDALAGVGEGGEGGEGGGD